MIDDELLSRETALMYQNAFGFEPVNGNLTHWRGVVVDRAGTAVSLDVNLPSNYPNSPPSFSLPRGTEHPSANAEGNIITRSLTQWRPSGYVYQVLRDVRQTISSAHFSKAVETEMSTHNAALTRQLDHLKGQLQQKQGELSTIEKTPASQQTTVTSREVAEESLINIDSDLFRLEDDFDRLEIDDVDFVKQFYNLRKRYYLIEATIK